MNEEKKFSVKSIVIATVLGVAAIFGITRLVKSANSPSAKETVETVLFNGSCPQTTELIAFNPKNSNIFYTLPALYNRTSYIRRLMKRM
jgi:hypothetical protein